MWRISAFFSLIICTTLVKGQPKVPCYFIFGDSLSEAGNNNALITMAKANYPPYGVDFPGGIPTGRFTNGRTIDDIITQLLGFQRFITPYSTIMGRDILRGVNFASGAAGILPETAYQLGDRMWLDRQLKNYAIIILKLQTMVQGPVADYLNKCLYTVNIGSNDYINNYFLPQFYPTKQLFTIEQYAERLITRYRRQLQVLYNSGARKVAIFGLGQLGCIPAEIARYNATQCVEVINQAVQVFNTKLVALVDNFNARLPRANFTFIDIYALSSNPLPSNFITNSTCCKLRSDYQCEPFTPPCADRSIYAFMDGFHPTEVVNEVVATISYNSPSPLFVHPVDINQLVST